MNDKRVNDVCALANSAGDAHGLGVTWHVPQRAAKPKLKYSPHYSNTSGAALYASFATYYRRSSVMFWTPRAALCTDADQTAKLAWQRYRRMPRIEHSISGERTGYMVSHYLAARLLRSYKQSRWHRHHGNGRQLYGSRLTLCAGFSRLPGGAYRLPPPARAKPARAVVRTKK